MLRTSFQKKPKRLVYRDYTSFSNDSILTDLSNSIENSQCYGAFETKTLDKHVPRKTKLLRGKHKPHISKKLRKKDNEKNSVKNYCEQDG